MKNKIIQIVLYSVLVTALLVGVDYFLVEKYTDWTTRIINSGGIGIAVTIVYFLTMTAFFNKNKKEDSDS